MESDARYFEKAREYLEYCEESGNLLFTSNRGTSKKGDTAGYDNGHGYLRVSVRVGGKRKELLNHRVAWYLTYGYIPTLLDHVNRDRKDNRLCNLRECTAQQNSANKTKSKYNKSGVTGVTKHSVNNSWRAFIQVNKKSVHLGTFESFEDAVKARKEAEEKYFGEFKPRN